MPVYLYSFERYQFFSPAMESLISRMSPETILGTCMTDLEKDLLGKYYMLRDLLVYLFVFLLDTPFAKRVKRNAFKP